MTAAFRTAWGCGGDPVKPGMAGREWGTGNGEWGM